MENKNNSNRNNKNNNYNKNNRSKNKKYGDKNNNRNKKYGDKNNNRNKKYGDKNNKYNKNSKNRYEKDNKYGNKDKKYDKYDKDNKYGNKDNTRKDEEIIEKPKEKKIKEDQALILGWRESKNKIKTAHVIGTQKFTLLKVELNENTEVKLQDKINIDNDSDKIKKVISTMDYENLSNNEKREIEKAVHSIIITYQDRYIEFFNTQTDESSKLHLLNGINRKVGLKLINEKEDEGPFISFENISKRIRTIKDPENIIAKRVIYEISELPYNKKEKQVYLFTNAKKGKRLKKYPQVDQFEEDDSFFLKKLKKEGIIPEQGRKLHK